MWRFILAIVLSLSANVWGAEDTRDTYIYRDECPLVGDTFPIDGFNFYKCQCTSYVAHKLNELWSNTTPRFTNQYYGFTRWGNAYEWLDRARSSQAEIGVTGARDNFVWDEGVYNAVFPGDVALWERRDPNSENDVGHVAFVEAAGPDVYGQGVAWVTISEYNIVLFEYSRRTLYKSNHPTVRFPDYFLHIDKDRIYCQANPTVDTCTTLMAGRVVATGPGSKYGGLGGFGSTSSFDIKINNFWARDQASQIDIVSGAHTVRTGQVLEVRLQQKAVNGDTTPYMRPGKDRVETDIHVQEDDQEWRFLGREYTQAANLPNGATHTEHVIYVVPSGVAKVRFKAKIDAEDEASEANEGNNWSPVITYTVDNNPTVNVITTAIQLTNTPTPVPPGSAMHAKMAIRNIGTTAPSVGIRSNYSYRPLGSTGPWTQIADDGSDPQDLVPHQDHWEETLSAVIAPLVPGWYELQGCADYQHAVLESNEADNCLTTTFQVGGLPDLIITYIGIDSWSDTSIRKGKTHHPTMKVKNVGTGPVTVTTRQTYYLYGPATGSVWVAIDGDDTEASALCVGCETTESINRGYAINKKGVHYLMACADPANHQVEHSETNNCLISAPITVK